MISLIIGSTDVSDKISAYQLAENPMSKGNAFTADDGTQVRNIVGYKTSLKLGLVKLSESEKDALAAALRAKKVTVSGDVSGEFICENGYTADLVRTRKKEAAGKNYFFWKMDFQLTKTETLANIGSGYL